MLIVLALLALIFLGSFFGLIVGLFIHMDRKNFREMRNYAEATALAQERWAQEAVLDLGAAFARARAELVRDEDLFQSAEWLRLGTKGLAEWRPRLQALRAENAWAISYESQQGTARELEAERAKLAAPAKAMDELCALRRTERAAVEKVLHALPTALAPLDEVIAELRARLDEMGDTHLERTERDRASDDLIDAIGDLALAAHFIERTRAAAFETGLHGPMAADAASSALKARDAAVGRVDKASRLLALAASQASQAGIRGRSARERLQATREGLGDSPSMLAVTALSLAEAWVDRAAGLCLSGRPLDARRADALIDQAWHLLNAVAVEPR